MDEVQLIEMMSYLDPELLENDYIEKDLSGFVSLISKVSDSKELSSDRGINSIVRIIKWVLLGTTALTGSIIISVLLIKKKGFNSKKGNLSFPKKISKKIVRLAME